MSWKYPILMLFGIGISNIGAWIYLIALNLIVLNMTNSPLAVSVLYILPSIATLFTNVWAGSYIDRLNKRKLMINLDIIRAGFIFILPILDSLFIIYVLVFLINIANTIFRPTSMIYITKLIPTEQRQKFNSLRNFINSSGFILGPAITGLLFYIGSPKSAIIINGIALVISAIIIYFLPNLELSEDKLFKEKVTFQLVKKDWKSIILFSKESFYVTFVYVLFLLTTVFMSSLDSLEAALATMVLGMDEMTYGVLLSMAGIGLIVGSLFNTVFSSKLSIRFQMIFGSILTPVGYLIFAFSTNFIVASIGFFVITFGLSFANTGFYTFYQNNVPTEIMGRFSSVFGILEATSIIILTAILGMAADLFTIQPVYIISSLSYFLLGIIIVVTLTFYYKKTNLSK